MMEGIPRVSVVMAVYNGARYLEEAIDSILRQQYRDFEFIIIDDGSGDGTAELLAGYTDPRIRVLRNKENLGLAESLNLGLAAARGEFVARQDADDVSEPDRLGKQVEYLDAHEDVALLGSAHVEIDAEGRVLGHVDANCDHVTILWAMLFYCPFAHTAVMFRRERVLDAVGPYDASYRYSMDYEYWVRIAGRFRVANLPDFLVRLRMHPTSMTATFGVHTSEGYCLQVRNLAALLDDDMAAEPDEVERRHRVLCALMFGPPSSFEVAQLLEGANLMLELQQRFARERRLSYEEQARHRMELRTHLFNALLSFACAEHAAGGVPSAVRRLAWKAVRLVPRRLFQPRTAAAVAALLVGHKFGRHP